MSFEIKNSFEKKITIKTIILGILILCLCFSVCYYCRITNPENDNTVEINSDYYSAYISQSVVLDSGFEAPISASYHAMQSGVEVIYENPFESLENITGSASIENSVVYDGDHSLKMRAATTNMINASLNINSSRYIYSDETADFVFSFYSTYSKSWTRDNTNINVIFHCTNGTSVMSIVGILTGNAIIAGNVSTDLKAVIDNYGDDSWNTVVFENIKDFAIYCNDSDIQLYQVDVLIDGPSSAGSVNLYIDDFSVVARPLDTSGSAWTDEEDQLVTSYHIESNYTIYVLQSVIDCDGSTINSQLDVIIRDYVNISKLSPSPISFNVISNWSIYTNVIDVAATFTSIENSSMPIGNTSEPAWKITGSDISHGVPLLYTTNRGTSLQYNINANYTVYCQLYNLNTYSTATLSALKAIASFQVDAASPIVIQSDSSFAILSVFEDTETIMITIIVLLSIGIIADLLLLYNDYIQSTRMDCVDKKCNCKTGYVERKNKFLGTRCITPKSKSR